MHPEISLALPSQYIQNSGSSSGKKEYETNHKPGSKIRNEEHWKWNIAR